LGITKECTLESALNYIIKRASSSMKNKNWTKYLFEFLSIFIAVISAFALSNWNDITNNQHSEQKILVEIMNSLEIDLRDFKININGNNLSLEADSVFRSLINGEQASQETIATLYIRIFRDYIPIINKSAYESLKANNLKTVTNDSLRIQIIELYDYYYSIIEKLEYEVPEMKSYKNYFQKTNTLLSPFMEFDENGDLIRFSDLSLLTENNKKEIHSYLWRIRENRKLKLNRYDKIIEEMKKLKLSIEKELIK
jgi:hypothetical protein